jgi:hypothetical protein
MKQYDTLKRDYTDKTPFGCFISCWDTRLLDLRLYVGTYMYAWMNAPREVSFASPSDRKRCIMGKKKNHTHTHTNTRTQTRTHAHKHTHTHRSTIRAHECTTVPQPTWRLQDFLTICRFDRQLAAYSALAETTYLPNLTQCYSYKETSFCRTTLYKFHGSGHTA